MCQRIARRYRPGGFTFAVPPVPFDPPRLIDALCARHHLILRFPGAERVLIEGEEDAVTADLDRREPAGIAATSGLSSSPGGLILVKPFRARTSRSRTMRTMLVGFAAVSIPPWPRTLASVAAQIRRVFLSRRGDISVNLFQTKSNDALF